MYVISSVSFNKTYVYGNTIDNYGEWRSYITKFVRERTENWQNERIILLRLSKFFKVNSENLCSEPKFVLEVDKREIDDNMR